MKLGDMVTLRDGRRGRVAFSAERSADDPENTRIHGPSYIVVVEVPACSVCGGPSRFESVHVAADEVTT